MRVSEIFRTLRKEKRPLITGGALILFAAAVVLCIIKFDYVRGAAKTLCSAAAPLLCGIIIAYTLNVFVRFFEDIVFKPLGKCTKKAWLKLKRPLAISLSYLLVFLLLILFAGFVIPGVFESMSSLGETLQKTLPATVNSVVAWVSGFAEEHELGFVKSFVSNIDWQELTSNLGGNMSGFLESVANVTFNLASAVFSAVMGFIFSFYMLFGKDKLLHGLKAAVLAFVSEKTSRKIARLGSVANQVFSSFIRGQFTECLILGMLCYIGMSVLGLDYALLISSIVAMGPIIPILGAYIGATVGAVILLLIHPMDALIFLVFLICLQQIEGNLIYPRVVGSSIGLPPIWTMFAVLFWGTVLGIPGILIGTPTTAVIYRLFREDVYSRLKTKGIDPLSLEDAEKSAAEEDDKPEKQ